MLDEKLIQRLKAESKPKKYADGGGLFLFIPVSGTKLWRMAYRFNHQAKLLSFGAYPEISLRVARQRRDEAKKLLRSGIDPAEYKKSKDNTEVDCSFKSITLEWLERQNLHCEQRYRNSLLRWVEKYLFNNIGDKIIDDITVEDLVNTLSPLKQSGKLCGGRTLVEIYGRVTRYAIATKRANSDITTELPSSLRPKTSNYRAAFLDQKQLGNIMVNLEKHNGYFPVSCALRLIPLVFVRASELRCAAWHEIDLKKRIWTIPAERMKTNKTHIVPLSKQAMKIINELKEYSESSHYLFPGIYSPQIPLEETTIISALRKRGYDNIKPSFRAIRSLTAQMLHLLGYDEKIITAQLGQNGRRSTQEKHDRYLKERSIMMQEWADYIYMLRDKALQN